MKTAIDFYARGKEKEASADEYDRSLFYSRERFICPECGDSVHLTGRKNSNHFSHYKKSDVSAECDRRVDGDPTDSVYERIGLPLYLKNTNSNDFQLYMAFKAIPKTILEKAAKDNVKMTIENKNLFRVNNERFSSDSTTLIPIDFIPAYGTKYNISFEPSYKSYALTQYWSDYSDGFSFDGALFTASGSGGKKVRHGDSITTEREYYWIRRQSQLPGYLPGVDMKRCGRLILKGSTLTVFFGTFSSDISDVEYRLLASFLRNNLKVHLLEKQPEFIPIWPPMIKTEEGYKSGEKTKMVYGHIVSGNDEPKVYCYQGIRKIPEMLQTNNFLTSVRLYEQFTLINIDRKYISSGTLLCKQDGSVHGYENAICDITTEEESVIAGRILRENFEKLSFKMNIASDVIIVRYQGIIERFIATTTCTVEDLRNGDQIFIIQGNILCAYILVHFLKQDTQVNSRELLIDIQKLSKGRKVNLPFELRRYLYDLKEMGISSVEMNRILSENLISIPLIKVLEGVKNGKV